MTAPISGASQNPIPPQQLNEVKQEVKTMEEALTMLKADMTELSDESLNFASAMKTDGGKKAEGSESHSQRLQKEEGAEHLDQAMQATMTDEVDQEKRIKKKKELEKKKFEEKMAVMAAFIKDVDMDSLPEELKEELKQLEDNLHSIKQRKGKLKQLDSQLEHYEKLLADADKEN
jgi:plasmid maintenance system killer protein